MSVINLKVIPARGSSTVHVSFTPLTLPEAIGEDRCVGVALGFVRLAEVMNGCTAPGQGQAKFREKIMITVYR